MAVATNYSRNSSLGAADPIFDNSGGKPFRELPNFLSPEGHGPDCPFPGALLPTFVTSRKIDGGRATWVKLPHLKIQSLAALLTPLAQMGPGLNELQFRVFPCFLS
jgi:hypothetical protein